MMYVLPIFAAMLIPVVAEAESQPEPEAAFVACLSEKQSELIDKIRDAGSEQAFIAALKEGAEVCPVEIDGMSMGKLFKALNAHKQGESDA
ncbi:MAG: hypothetical protein R3D99_10700 [Altererythrobacter sp.]